MPEKYLPYALLWYGENGNSACFSNHISYCVIITCPSSFVNSFFEKILFFLRNCENLPILQISTAKIVKYSIFTSLIMSAIIVLEKEILRSQSINPMMQSKGVIRNIYKRSWHCCQLFCFLRTFLSTCLTFSGVRVII